ncbi:FecR domain-containing protein [Dyadobacter sp. LHD-138]|uniref:FecR family protein n=1 Tax=Dyadobacter sp. LHD-138 TaxID=3071413 RepID=UPI0027E1D186|nr:FecR domain-containing protein [Dyadobacter sp. LHD-138]MDQ6479420.1 FecR domain-containing protein [Dyadobacter sp. LHD-138]
MNELFDRADLISRYLRGDLTAAERVWLDQWLKEDIRNQQLLDALENEATVSNDLLFFASIDQTAAWQKINRRIRDSDERSNQNFFARYWKYAAASVVVGLLSYGMLRNTYKVDRLGGVALKKTMLENDIPPGKDKATLTLSDGKVITLETIKDGTSIEQDGIKMTKKDGKVYYQVLAGGDTKNIHYNTIKTPVGGQYTIILPDGSQVWLNASSSLHFPTVFAGNTRKVDLIGECYFEIARDRTKPFIVQAGKTQVEVLGTHFNVMAYADEGNTKTTLVEGAVKVGNETSSKTITPGQQASVGAKIDVQSVNTEEAIAWKNGFFQFENQDLGTILRQLTRWYNVEIANEDQIPDSHFTAVIPRNITLSHVLQMLEMSGELEFEVVENKITIKQKK